MTILSVSGENELKVITAFFDGEKAYMYQARMS